MKKVLYGILILLTIFLTVGCSKEENNKKENEDRANLRKITGQVIKAQLDASGNIVINEKEITNKVVYISYEYEEVIIGLLAVRDSKGDVKVVVNTCQSCGGSPYAYFVQVGDEIECQNCGNRFKIDNLDNLQSDGCNPIAIEDKKEEYGKIIINTEQLKKLKSKFENWKGPKELDIDF